MSVSRVLILALVGLLLGTTGCKLTPPTENEFEFTAVFEDDFSSLRGRAWDAQRRQGGKEPRVRDGRLELRSDDAGFGGGALDRRAAQAGLLPRLRGADGGQQHRR